MVGNNTKTKVMETLWPNERFGFKSKYMEH